MIRCGLCDQPTRHIGSHVINEHCAYAAGQDAITGQLRAELIARAKRDSEPLPYQRDEPDAMPGHQYHRKVGPPLPYQSPSTRRALSGELPGKVLR